MRQAEADVEAARTALAAARKRRLGAALAGASAHASRTTTRSATSSARNRCCRRTSSPPPSATRRCSSSRGPPRRCAPSQAQVASAEAQVANARAVVKQREAALAQREERPLEDRDHRAGRRRRHLAPGRARADGRREPQHADAVHDRAGPVADAGRRRDRRVGHRPHPRRTSARRSPSTRSRGARSKAAVRQIRKAAQTVQNVVTYIVVVGTRNPSLTLVPGMTANVRIVADQRSNVLKVPNAALRWRPAGHDGAARRRAAGRGGRRRTRRSAGPAPAARRRAEARCGAGRAPRRDLRRDARPAWPSFATCPRHKRRQRGERLRAEVRQRINAMLNAEQQKRYAEIVASDTGRSSVGAGRRPRLRARRRAGPKEVAVAHRPERRHGDRGRQRRDQGGRRGDRRHVQLERRATAAPAAVPAPRLPF